MNDSPRHDRSGDELEPLFGVAGRRPRLPEHELAPIRAAARGAWRRQLQRAAVRRWAGSAVGLAAGALLVVGLLARDARTVGRGSPTAAASPVEVGELLLEVGEVTVLGPDGAIPDGLRAGSTVVTGRGGRAAVRLSGGTSVRIDVESTVRLEAATLVALDRGAVYVDSNPRSPHAPIAVVTPLGTVRHRGTQFEVRLFDDLSAPAASGAAVALRVTVREGALDVDRGGRAFEARAGVELTLRADGSLEQSSAPSHGATWDWTQEAAPPFPIEGSTLAAFLDWVSRETALPWRFGDSSLEAIARETILHGSIAGLTPEEALSVVLPGCGLRHRRVEAALVLEPARRR